MPYSPERLRQAREDAGLRREDVASSSGLSHQTVWRLERGGFSPHLDTLEAVANVLCISIADLIDTDEAAHA